MFSKTQEVSIAYSWKIIAPVTGYVHKYHNISIIKKI